MQASPLVYSAGGQRFTSVLGPGEVATQTKAIKSSPKPVLLTTPEPVGRECNTVSERRKGKSEGIQVTKQRSPQL